MTGGGEGQRERESEREREREREIETTLEIKNPNNSAVAVAWLGWLAAGLSPQRPMHVGFVADQVAMGQVLLPILRSYPVRTISTHMHLQQAP